MNVEATLAAVNMLLHREPRVPYSNAARQILTNAVYHLNYSLKQYLTRGEGKD